MWRTRKRFFWINYEFLMVWRKRELYATKKLRKDKVILDLKRATLLEEMSWRQKSLTLRLKEGYKCIKFFYQVANLNTRNNSIEMLVYGLVPLKLRSGNTMCNSM
jgi:hypothetical protein